MTAATLPVLSVPKPIPSRSAGWFRVVLYQFPVKIGEMRTAHPSPDLRPPSPLGGERDGVRGVRRFNRLSFGIGIAAFPIYKALCTKRFVETSRQGGEST